jgi:hypothetical protein
MLGNTLEFQLLLFSFFFLAFESWLARKPTRLASQG